MCFVLVKFFIFLTTFLCHCSHITDTTIIITITAYSTQPFTTCSQLQLFCSHGTSHKGDWIPTDCCPLCLALLYTHIRLQNVLKVEDSWSRLLENSIAKKLCMCILILVCHACMLLLVYLEGLRCISVLSTH